MNAWLLALLIVGAAADRLPHWHRPAKAAATAPQRIVSLAPVVTETLFLLGAGDRVVGVTRFCDRPPAASTRTSVGGYTDASLEKILELKPDVVVAMPSFGQRALLDRLRDQGIAVFVVFTDTLDEENAMMLALGDLVAAPAKAQALVQRQAEILVRTKERGRGQGQRAVVVVGHDPLVVAGPGTFAEVALRATGADSAVLGSDPSWPQWSLESLLARKVDVVIAAEGPTVAAGLRTAFAPLGARAPRVVAADTAILMRPGPSFADDILILEGLLTPTSR